MVGGQHNMRNCMKGSQHGQIENTAVEGGHDRTVIGTAFL